MTVKAKRRLNRSEIKIPVSMVGESEEVLDRYRELVANGESPGMASILASRSAPALETATNHFVGVRSIGNPGMADYEALVRNQAKKAGIPVTENSHYNPTIADHRRGGDPGAWIHNGESHDKWRKTCEERGMSCDDLRTRNDGKIAEIEEKREKRIRKQDRHRAAVKEFMADKKKKLGLPE